MEEDKVIYAVKNSGVYEDLFDEVMVWLDSMCDVGTVKANFRGVYDYLSEISVTYDRYDKEGLIGIAVTVPEGFGMLDYAERVAKKFGLEYKVETKTYRKGNEEVLTMYIEENAPCAKIPFMQSDKDFRDEWYKKHNGDRTASWTA